MTLKKADDDEDDRRKQNLNLRVSKRTKDALETMAREDYRSITSTIEMMVDQEVRRRLAAHGRDDALERPVPSVKPKGRN